MLLENLAMPHTPSVNKLSQHFKDIIFKGAVALAAGAAISCEAASSPPFQHPYYVGGAIGYGSTTWSGLVPSNENANIAINLSAPIGVKEGGEVWGIVGGYEVSPFFALEVNYSHYPSASIEFNKYSLFSFKHPGIYTFSTDTDVIGVMGKIMLLVPDSKLRIYSSIGASNVYRNDMLVSRHRVTPSFGAGLNYHFNERWMGELGGTYTAGYGEALLNPVDTYWPFLYSGGIKLLYSFG